MINGEYSGNSIEGARTWRKVWIFIFPLVAFIVFYNWNIISFISKAIQGDFLDLNRFLYDSCRDAKSTPLYFGGNDVNEAWAEELRSNYNIFLEEFDSFALTHEVAPVDFLQPSQRFLNDLGVPWSTLYLKVASKPTSIAKKYFPKSLELLKRTPLVTAFFSIIKPNGRLIFHRGFYRGELRYHLALRVPETEPQPYMLLFDDPSSEDLISHKQLLDQLYKDGDGDGDGEELNEDGSSGYDDLRVDEFITYCATIQCAIESSPPRRKAFNVSWSDSHDFLFDDCFEHGVVNPQEKTRMILLGDLIRNDCPAHIDVVLKFFGNWIVWWMHPEAVTILTNQQQYYDGSIAYDAEQDISRVSRTLEEGEELWPGHPDYPYSSFEDEDGYAYDDGDDDAQQPPEHVFIQNEEL